MTLALAAILWVLAATATAFLPMRWQIGPGLALLAAAPVLIGWTLTAHGWLPAAVAAAAFVSMFRRPLGHLARRIAGRPAAEAASAPPEEER